MYAPRNTKSPCAFPSEIDASLTVGTVTHTTRGRTKEKGHAKAKVTLGVTHIFFLASLFLYFFFSRLRSHLLSFHIPYLFPLYFILDCIFFYSSLLLHRVPYVLFDFRVLVLTKHCFISFFLFFAIPPLS